MTGRADAHDLVRGVRLADCRNCHEPIRFVRLDTGKSLPVNPLPDAAGTVQTRRIGRELHGAVVYRGTDPQGTFRMMPHPATCTERRANRRTPPPAPPPALF